MDYTQRTVATIRVELDGGLLELADEIAKKRSVNRSALIREAVRSYVKKAWFEELERQESLAYIRQPDDAVDAHRWERAADWPDD